MVGANVEWFPREQPEHVVHASAFHPFQLERIAHAQPDQDQVDDQEGHPHRGQRPAQRVTSPHEVVSDADGPDFWTAVVDMSPCTPVGPPVNMYKNLRRRRRGPFLNKLAKG